MKKLFYLFLLPLCLGFSACGDDDEKVNGNNEEKNDDKKDDSKTDKDSDLIGWWAEPELYSSTASPNKSRHALHFIGNSVVESTFVVVDEKWDNYNSYNDAGDYVFTYNSIRHYYSKQNSVFTYAYERKGNTIQLLRSNENDNYVILTGDKLKWVDRQYVKVANN